MNKTIALFQPGQTAVIASTPLYQYDYGQILEISGLELPETFTVDFGGVCDAETKPWLGANNSVVIPDEYLQTGQSINAYIYLHTGVDDGETEYKISIVVIPRPERSQETPTPQQQSVIDQAIAALNAGVASASTSAASAALAASHYPRIIGGEWYVWSVEGGAYVSTGIDAEGADGYSPTVQVTPIEGGHRVTITDAVGPQTFDVMDGQGGGAGAVESVNGKTGAVELDAEDVGALPDTTTLDDVPDGTTYKRATGAQLQQIGANAAAIQTQGGEIDALQSDVDAIESKIPAQASASNQLADKDFVNSSINSSAAYFRGAFATHAALMAVQWQTSDPAAENYVSNNDYAYVADDETHSDEAWRYIYVLQPGGQNNGWQPQFRVNESPLTAAQLAALNSGATAALIEQISTNAAAIALRQAIINESGVLKGGGNGQVSAAVAGTDYLAPSALTPYRTAAAQDVIDATKLDKTGDGSDVTVTFTQAATRTAIATGEKLSVLLGKIAKWLADLGTAAWKNATNAVTSGSSDLVESGAVYTAVAAKYTKPPTGIPGTDLASGVIPTVPGAYASNPAALGTADPGSSGSWARGDHVHPMPSAADIGAQPATVVVTVTGTTPTIVAEANHRYVCGEVATLDLTLPVSGICDVIFTSGSTATVLTVPSSVRWAGGFDPSALDANTTYEINIMDGIGVAASVEVTA